MDAFLADDGDKSKSKKVTFGELELAENLALVVLTVVGLIIFSVLFEWNSHRVKKKGGKITKAVFHHILEELSTLGLISFVLFGIQYWGNATIPKKSLLFFEFIHLELFVTTIGYVLVVYLLGIERIIHVRRWRKFDKIILSQVDQDDDEKLFGPGLATRFERFEFRRYVATRKHFIRYNYLTLHFSYAEYLKLCLNHMFLQVIKANWRIGGALLLWIVGSYIILPIYAKTGNPQRNLFLLYSAIIIAYVIALIGVFCSIKLHSLARKLKHDGIAINPAVEGRPPRSQPDLTSPEGNIGFQDSIQLSLLGRRRWAQKVFPFFYERDPYRKQFPLADVNFFIHFIQFALIFQVLYLTLFGFLFREILTAKKTAAIVFGIGFFPPIYVLMFLAPGYLPLLCMIRYTGPLTKERILNDIMRRDERSKRESDDEDELAASDLSMSRDEEETHPEHVPTGKHN
jgi:hypothetical protein